MAKQIEQLNTTEAVQEHSSEVIHEATVFAEPIVHFGGFTVTNAMINSWIVVLVIIILTLSLKAKAKLVPGKMQNIWEVMIDGFLSTFDSITNSREKSMRFFPFVFAFFIFILFNNWIGLIPGVGTFGQIVSEHGEKVFVPYFRGATADVNTTFALASIGVVVSHILGVMAIGWWGYLNKFINLKALIEIPGKVAKDPTVLIINPIKVFVGLIEIVGELAKVASLSFRLFGNIYAGEVLLASMSAILAFGLPIPFYFMEVIVGLVQAVVFAMLILAFLTMNTTAEEH